MSAESLVFGGRVSCNGGGDVCRSPSDSGQMLVNVGRRSNVLVVAAGSGLVVGFLMVVAVSLVN